MNKSEFVNRIYSEKYVSKVISKVKLLGYDSNVSAYDIILIRLFTSVILFILMLYVFDYGYIFGPIITLIYYFMFNRIVLDNKIKKDSTLIDKSWVKLREKYNLQIFDTKLNETYKVMAENTKNKKATNN